MTELILGNDTRRLLAGTPSDRRPMSLAEHRRRHGALDAVDGSLVDVCAEARLTGRGGGGFPTARKLAAVRGAGKRAIVVVNGAEGEPIAGKDKVLLAYLPHLVLDGAVVAAHAVRAREVVVGAHPAVHSIVQRAIGERTDDGVTLHAVAVPDTFVAGEETALVQYLGGGPALPTATPPRPFERGLRGLPTLVQNAETLAHLGLIARNGAAWFRGVGTADEPGTTLFTLTGVRHDGVYEVPLGYPLSSLLADAGGPRSEPAAFLVGGYFGAWLRADAAGVALADAELRAHGASLGARAIVVLPRNRSGLAETARILQYLAAQSAGQCGPCVHGLAAVADDVARIARRDRAVDRGLLERRLSVIAGRGACSHPDGAVRLAASALEVFA